MSLAPPHTTPADRKLPRKVAMAYRSALEAGKARDAAMVVYLEERPDEKSDALAASAKVAEMIASAVAVDPA